MYTFGAFANFENCLSVPNPIPLVAPTKTATSPGSEVALNVELEIRTSSIETIVRSFETDQSDAVELEE